MATTRYQLLRDCVMLLDGQLQIVLSGTVFDDNSAVRYDPTSVTTLSPGETAGPLASHGKPTPVRGKRTR